MAAEDEEFEWRGQAGLGVRACQFRHPLGYRPQHVLQLEPPSAVTSLALHSDWGLLAAGQLILSGMFTRGRNTVRVFGIRYKLSW